MQLGNLPVRRLLAAFVSLVLIALAFWLSGVESVVRQLAGFPLWALGSILVLLLVNLVVVSYRFWSVLRHFGVVLPWKVAWRASVAGQIAGLVVISLFGQVMGRQAVLKNFGMQAVVSASLAAYERTMLALVSGTLGMLGGFYLLGNTAIAGFFQRIPLIEIAIAALGGSALSLWLGFSRFETKLSYQMFSWANFRRVMAIAGLTLAGQLLILGCFVLGILAVSPHVPVASSFAAAAIISLAASMPITVNGWGIREVTAVYVLGKLGIPPSAAVGVSVLIGLCSTLVILAVAPFSIKKLTMPKSAKPLTATVHSVSEIEKSSAWVLGMIVAVAVFFQVHVALRGGLINLNLADPFAILALTGVSLHALFSRQAPAWRIKHFNLALAAISLVLVFGFIRGWLEIGVTQWALAGRLLGWLVLLGYLSAGHLVVTNVGTHGMRRLAETLISFAAAVVLLQVALRLLDHWGINTGAQPTPNFEGYAGNRNAFAFQLLVVMTLLLGYSEVYARHRIEHNRPARPWIFSVLLGILLAGLVWTGSRAGLLVGLMMLILAWFGRLANRRILAWGLVFGALLWSGLWLGAQDTQTSFSGESSNQERWESLTYALKLWRESPVFGAGLGVFNARSVAWFGHPLVIHNTPLWILAEFGLAGAAVMGWAFFLLARHAIPFRKAPPARRALLSLLLVFAIFGLAHEIFYQRIFWFVLGALLSKCSSSGARA